MTTAEIGPQSWQADIPARRDIERDPNPEGGCCTMAALLLLAGICAALAYATEW